MGINRLFRIRKANFPVLLTIKKETIIRSDDEKELLQRLSNDDNEAFRILLERHHRVCYQAIIDILRDRAVAEDVVQEVFLKVWLRRKKMPEVDNFSGWLRTVAVNVVYYRMTKWKKDRDRSQHWWREMYLSAPAGREPASEETYFEELLSQAIKRLTSKQLETFNLIKKEGYTREEAARLLGVSPETVKTNLERAMKTIKTYCISKMDIALAFIMVSIFFRTS